VSSIYAELVFLAIVGIGVVVLFARAGIWWAGAAALLAIGGAQLFTWFLFTNVHILLDSANPSWGLALAFARRHFCPQLRRCTRAHAPQRLIR
jgi:hypothetical protein